MSVVLTSKNVVGLELVTLVVYCRNTQSCYLLVIQIADEATREVQETLLVFYL